MSEIRRVAVNTPGDSKTHRAYLKKRVGEQANEIGTLREQVRQLQQERDDIQVRWDRDNLCGICPYRKSLQARLASLTETAQGVLRRVDAALDAAMNQETNR